MTDEEIKLEVNKIIQRWSWERWFYLIISIVSVSISFYMLWHEDKLYSGITNIPSIVYGVLGAAGIGHVIRNWNGNIELKLLKNLLKIN